MYADSGEKFNESNLESENYSKENDYHKNLNYNKSLNTDIIITNPANLIGLDSSKQDLNFKKLAREKLLETESEIENYDSNSNSRTKIKKIPINSLDENLNKNEIKFNLKKFFSDIKEESNVNGIINENTNRNVTYCVSGEAFSK
jgi:hypothetical protein